MAWLREEAPEPAGDLGGADGGAPQLRQGAGSDPRVDQVRTRARACLAERPSNPSGLSQVAPVA